MTSVAERPFSVAFLKIAELGGMLDAAPLSKHAGCWEHRLDARWWMAVNGHAEPCRTTDGVEVPAFTAYLTFNGWPFGFLDPYDGCLGHGEAANEDALIAALDSALAASRPAPPETQETT